MGRGEYAGQPATFACSQCRKHRNFYDSETKSTSETIGRCFRTTGKLRPQASQGSNYHRWPHHAYQYVCLGCGHKGWSRHPDVERVYRKEHTAHLDWERLKIYFREGRQGRLSAQGEVACEEAYKLDPERYSKLKREATKEVDDEMRNL
jgi:hypothetical protein